MFDHGRWTDLLAGLTDTYVAAYFVAGHTLSPATMSTFTVQLLRHISSPATIIMCRWATTCAVKPGAERLRMQSPATKYARRQNMPQHRYIETLVRDALVYVGEMNVSYMEHQLPRKKKLCAYVPPLSRISAVYTK